MTRAEREGWRVATGMGLLGYIVWGVGFYTMPVFYVPLEAEFHWSRTQVTFAGALTFFFYSVSGPVVGAWLDAAGVRKVVAAGVTLFGAALTLFALGMSSLGTFYVLGCVVGLACMCVSLLPSQILVARWFGSKKALVMGWVLALMALGGVVNAALAGKLITRMGWRQTILVFDLMVWLLALPICLLVIKERPAPAEPAAEPRQRAAEAPTVQASLREALRSPYFYLLCGSVFLNRAAGNAVLQNLVLHVKGLGHSLEFGAYVMSGLAVANLSSRLVVGAMSDRLSLRFGVILSYACIALALVMLLSASGKPFLFATGLVIGLGYGGSILMMPVLTAALFGTRALGKILGVVLLASGVGSTCGTYVVGRIYDATQSYRGAFLLLLACAVASIFVVWPVRPRAPGRATEHPGQPPALLNIAWEKKE